MKIKTLKHGFVAAGSAIAMTMMIGSPMALAGETQNKTVEKDVEVIVEDKLKQVIKINTVEDGKTVKKHYEIVTENDEKKAYSIDEAGNKTEVEISEVEGLDMPGLDIDLDGKNVKIFKMKDGGEWHSKDGEKKMIKKRIMMTEDGEKVTIMGEGDGSMDMDHNVFVHKGDGKGEHRVEKIVIKSEGDVGGARLEAASRLIEHALGDAEAAENSKAVRQLKKAQKAIKSAKAAMEPK